jgi:tetratricopeptide (TPR) repeat protein
MVNVAATFYKATLSVTTGLSAPYSNLATIYKQQGHYAEAIACYNEVMRVDPMAADGLVNRGNTLKEIGRVNDAIQDYIHAITIRPTMAEGHANLASAYKDRLCLNLGTFRLICNYWLLNNLSGYCEWTRGALMGSRFCPIEVRDSLV